MNMSRFRPGATSLRSGLRLVVATLSAVGCAPVPNPRNVAEYRANPALRARDLARCANDPGTLRTTSDCANARTAERLESLGQLRSLAPLSVPPPAPAARVPKE